MHRLTPSIFFVFAAAARAAEAPPVNATVVASHGAEVLDVAWSPDGSLAASSGADGTVKLWRASDWTEHASLAAHQGKALAIAFGPDGSLLVTGGEDKTLKLWKVPSAVPERIAAGGAPARALAEGHDGRQLFVALEDRTIRAIDRGSRKEDLAIRDLGAVPISLAASPDGLSLAAGLDDGSLRVFALETPPAPVGGGQAVELVAQGAEWRCFKGSAEPPAGWEKPGFDDAGWSAGASGFGFSSATRELAAVKTRLDDMEDRFLSFYARRTFQAPAGKIEKMTLTVLYDDGFVAYLNGVEVARENIDGTPPPHNKGARSAIEPKEATVDLGPHIGKLNPGANVLAIQGHNSSLSSSDFILTPVLRAAVKLPEPPPSAGPLKPGSEVRRIAGLAGPALALAFTAGGRRIASAGDAGAIQVHSLDDGAEIARLEGHAGAIRGLASLADGTLASACGDGKVLIWSLEEKKAIRSLSGHRGAVTALAIRPDRTILATGGEDRSVRVWDPAKGKEVLTFLGGDGAVRSVAFGSGGSRIASGSAGGGLLISSAESGKPVSRATLCGEVRAIAGAPDGSWSIAGPGDGYLEWRSEAPAALRTLSGHTDLVHGAAFSPDGRFLVSAGADRTVRTWTVEGGALRSIEAHGGSAYCAAWSPDGKTIASGGFDGKVKLWGAADGSPKKTLEGHEEGIFCLAFASPDLLLTGSADRTVRLWSVAKGEAIGVLDSRAGWIADIAVSAREPRAFTIDYEGELVLWDLEGRKALSRMKIPGIIHAIALSPDGRILAGRRDGALLTIDTR
jgi:WD40 repeat protein